MPASKSPGTTNSKPVRRAKVACRACNARRVRCDVAESQPCWHCRNRQTPCEIMESRRGKYDRQKRRSDRLAAYEITERSFPEGGGDGQSSHDDSISGNSQYDTRGTEQESERYSSLPFHEASSNTTVTTGKDHPPDFDIDDDDSGTLFARMADVEPTSPVSSKGTDPENNTFYLGEAFSLTFVVKAVCSPSGDISIPPRVHYPIPPSVNDRTTQSPTSLSHIDQDTLAFLEARGGLTLLPSELSDALVLIYFRTFHPAWPVLDRCTFEAQYRQGTVSHLLLQTIYFLAITVCNEDLLKQAGFDDREKARTVFYNRAKVLYDADYENDKTILTAVLLLLAFWWQKPQDQKDTWHWLGCSISLAQTLGMHRSTAYSGLSQRSRSLWKRIWWSLYVRDRHTAASLGRPFRIHDKDCDVEALHDEDFDFDRKTTLAVMGEQESYYQSYAIHMSRLAVIMGQVLTLRFSPKQEQKADEFTELGNALQQWEQQLPSEMLIRPVRSTLDAPFWAAMLHASYHNTNILLYRPMRVVPEVYEEEWYRQAMQSADLTTRIAEDLLAAGNLRQGQLHLVPALFAALAIHTIVIRRNIPIRRQLAENRARQCMLALSELSKSWPSGGWILRLFVGLMFRLTGSESNMKSAPLVRPEIAAVQHRASARCATLSAPWEANQAASCNPNENAMIQFNLGAPDTTLVAGSIPAPTIDQGLADFDFLFQQSLANWIPDAFPSEPSVHDRGR
ncbi:cutinase transcription factor 1 alpha [Metarhizium guizhouense ARSEF 977]|uniref:Cutinase transcription factor 1 alpha n=1 Tax=Metarhizium guizhouense (strain ARSEF 977) TaxID=1276136 RepID=A0A0B4GP31_METGA|nr:cutinase transcription factor 1 alpha [Metarhizium guizhouense ARSEF 977]